MPIFRRRPAPSPGTGLTPARGGPRPEVTEAPPLLDALGEAVILVGPARGVVWMNAAARELFPAREGEGRPLLELVRDHRLEALVIQAGATAGAQVLEIEQTSPVRVLRGRAVPLGMGEIALLVEDITGLRGLETVRQQFVANLSHELRTPLAGLDLAAQTLAAQLSSDRPERVFVDRILKESQRLTAMVTNLTQLAALDAEAVRPQQEVFAVRPLLDDQAARSAERARAAGLTLEVNCPPELRARGDAAKTDQALHNILDNALKFTVAGGVVLAGRRDGMVEISVRDTGVGIAPHDLPRIFERFYKADRARSAGGTGLGLAIARHLVELQDGTLRAESTPGAGTIVRLRLPAADGGD